MATYENHIDIVKWLLDAGVDSHLATDFAIQIALENGYMDIAELLKKYMENEG